MYLPLSEKAKKLTGLHSILIYRVDKKNMSMFKLQYLKTLHYIWSKFLTLLLHDIFIPA
jgi:hypothetical protein